MGKKKKWSADVKEGALTKYLRNTFGDKAFTQRGTIKKGVLQSLADGKKTMGVKPSKLTRQRARYAINRQKRTR